MKGHVSKEGIHVDNKHEMLDLIKNQGNAN